MSAFPRRLKGQGFFPGGDGLWREEDRLRHGCGGSITTGGIMFLGNDFGTLQKFHSTLRRGYENPTTWRNLRPRLERTDIQGKLGFFTNAILGLRTKGSALKGVDWTRHRTFAHFCREFLEFQLETIRPRLLVILGQHAKDAVCSEVLIPIVPE